MRNSSEWVARLYATVVVVVAFPGRKNKVNFTTRENYQSGLCSIQNTNYHPLPLSSPCVTLQIPVIFFLNHLTLLAHFHVDCSLNTDTAMFQTSDPSFPSRDSLTHQRIYGLTGSYSFRQLCFNSFAGYSGRFSSLHE